MKRSFYPRMNNNSIIEIDKEKGYYEMDMGNNRSNSMINTDNFSQTTLKFYKEKLG